MTHLDDDAQQRVAQAAAREVISCLFGLSRSLALYETNNSAVTRLLDDLDQHLQAYFQGTSQVLRLQVVADEFFVNGHLLRVDPQFWEKAAGLSELLARLKLGEVVMEPGITREELDRFAEDLSDTIRGGANRLHDDGYGHFSVAPAVGRSSASYRAEPHQLAMVLYERLCAATRQACEALEAGEIPSLLPLKRTLQSTIDVMAEDGALFQVLAASTDPRTTPPRHRVAASTAVDMVGFGHFLSLDRNGIMTLALAAALGRVSGRRDLDEALAPLFRLSSLGDVAAPLILAVHDARALRMGQPGGVAGQILAVVEGYHSLITRRDDRPAVAPHQALRSLVEGRLAGVPRGPAQLFAEYKGPYPLGSLVVLSSGAHAMVVSQGKTRLGKLRPRVALVGASGRLGSRMDLGVEHEVSIVGVPDVAAEWMNLLDP